MSWRIDGGIIVMTADTQTWAEHKLGTRGSWYRASFENPAVLREAKALALAECPGSIEQLLTIENAKIQIAGGGILEVNTKEAVVTVRGRVEFLLGPGMILENRLNLPRFKEWLATASISCRLARPLSSSLQDGGNVSPARSPIIPALSRGSPKMPVTKQTSTHAMPGAKNADVPTGLKVLPNFISDDEERQLLLTIDAHEWDRSMKRRVQHYGWRYDYKARQVTSANFLGPLPRWAENLAERLLVSGIVPELPDQVIVNDYDGKQGISKHIDCKDCFRGPIVTISLLETWDMIFTRKIAGETAKFVQPLLRCSAVILDGDARSTWYHAIPARLREGRVMRGRRVSITFRKVAV